MNRLVYAAGRGVGRAIFFCTMRLKAIRPEIPERAVRAGGGYVLALTHLGHLDPFIASVMIERPICWMARREFFHFPPIAWLLRQMGTFSVDRCGIPVGSIRHAIRLAGDGNAVGICPEGGVVRGSHSVLCGGGIRTGVCSIAIRAGVPIIPCVLIGSAELSKIGPWLPAKRGRLWVAYGEPIMPAATRSTRPTRDALRRQLVAAYGELYAELRREFVLDDAARRDEYREPLLMGRGVG